LQDAFIANRIISKVHSQIAREYVSKGRKMQKIKATKNFRIPSQLKARILYQLRNNSEKDTKALKKTLSAHPSSISHALTDMTKENLIAKTAYGYQLTPLGLVYLDATNNMVITLEALTKNAEFFLTHDLSCIPASYQTIMGMLLNNQEPKNIDFSIPYHMQATIASIIRESKDIRLMSSIMVPEQVRAIVNAAGNGANVTIITEKRTLAQRKYFIDLHGEISGYKNLKIYYTNDELNMNMIITESLLTLILRRFDGSYDLDDVIISKDQEAIEWGRMLFCHFINGPYLEFDGRQDIQ